VWHRGSPDGIARTGLRPPTRGASRRGGGHRRCGDRGGGRNWRRGGRGRRKRPGDEEGQGRKRRPPTRWPGKSRRIPAQRWPGEELLQPRGGHRMPALTSGPSPAPPPDACPHLRPLTCPSVGCLPAPPGPPMLLVRATSHGRDASE
jgi:hypothetical protein